MGVTEKWKHNIPSTLHYYSNNNNNVPNNRYTDMYFVGYSMSFATLFMCHGSCGLIGNEMEIYVQQQFTHNVTAIHLFIIIDVSASSINF